MNKELKPILIGNSYGINSHGGYGGDVFHPDGICRTLNSASGGAAETLVMIEEPRMLTVQRTEQAKQRRRVYGDVGVKFAESKEYTLRQDDMSNTITTVEKDNLLVEPTACAIRTHNYREEPTRLIMGGEVANALTSVQKDSMVAEPTMIQPNCFTGERKFTESDVTQCLTSAKQRQMHIKEPIIQRVGNVYPSKGQGGGSRES